MILIIKNKLDIIKNQLSLKLKSHYASYQVCSIEFISLLFRLVSCLSKSFSIFILHFNAVRVLTKYYLHKSDQKYELTHIRIIASEAVETRLKTCAIEFKRSKNYTEEWKFFLVLCTPCFLDVIEPLSRKLNTSVVKYR